ncbi:MAG: hypothetical protein AB8B86_14550 [Pseudomonadales bacterium]
MTQKSTILADPSWFPASLDVESDRVGFAKITRQALAQEAFLDQRMAGSVTGQKSLLLSDLLVETIDSSPLPVFIFHSAFCCSTLLARALDAPNIALSLKEPDILMALANAIRVNKELQQSPQQTRRYSELLIKLLSRRFSNKEQLVIKPTNTANNILPLVAEMGAQIVILHSDLRSFLISVLKKGEPCKAFVRQQYNIFALDPNGLGAIPQRQAMGFTDLQVAATVWRHQMELFQRTLSARPANQVVSLDSKTLTSNASTVLPAVARHFGLNFSKALLNEVANGPVFQRNAKFSDEQYDSDQRDREASMIEERYGPALDVIEQWATQLNLGSSIDWPLPKTLELE